MNQVMKQEELNAPGWSELNAPGLPEGNILCRGGVSIILLAHTPSSMGECLLYSHYAILTGGVSTHSRMG